MTEYGRDSLENFFRNRAEDIQYEYREEDWVKMEAKLDAAEGASGFVFSKYFWMAIGALLSSMLFLIYLQIRKPVDSEVAGGANNSSNITPDLKEEIFSNDLKSSGQNIPSIKSGQGNSERKQPSEKDAGTTEVNSLIRENIQSPEISGKDEKTYDSESKHITSNNTLAIIFTEQNKVISPDKQSTEEQYISKQMVVPGASSLTLSDGFNQAYYIFPDYYHSFPVQDIKPLNDEQKVRRFYTLGLVGAMDISTTKASAWGQPVLRIGISGEYFIKNRLSIGIGVNLSEKKYSAKGREYSPPKGFWTNGVVPDSTNAVCQILDVPVTISYYHPVGKKGSIVFHGGLSSWFMLREDYWYKYASNDPDLVSWWGGENEYRYWFGIFNPAISYEYMLTNKWSVMAGPYVNLPLTGIGHGNVELKSFGLRASVRINRFKLSDIK